MAVPAVKARSDAGFFRLSGISAEVAGPQPAQKSWIPIPGSVFGSGSGMQRRVYYPILLSVLFVLAFAIPVAVAAKIGGMFRQERPTETAADEIFPESLVMTSPEQRIEVISSAELEPAAGKDFLVIGWFKFRKVPATGERVTLLSKTESGPHARSGYSLVVAGDDGGIRPMIFWGGTDGGKWYKFTDLKVPAREWLMVALSVRDGRYLGLNVAEAFEPGKANLQLLGGYDLENAALVSNDLPLTVAPPGAVRFSGRVGPIGVFRLEGLTDKLQEILKKVSRRPLESLDAFSKKEVSLWWPGGEKDLGPHAQKITIVGVQKGKKVASAEDGKRA